MLLRGLCNNQICLLICFDTVHIMPLFLLSTQFPRMRPESRCRESCHKSPHHDSKQQVRCRQGCTRPSRHTSQSHKPSRQTCQADGQAKQTGQAHRASKQTDHADNRCSTPTSTTTNIWVDPAHKTVPSMPSRKRS